MFLSVFLTLGVSTTEIPKVYKLISVVATLSSTHRGLIILEVSLLLLS